ncbi:MAG: hypothetical protein R3F05_18595 [Planctomycetota bacterium]
MADQQLEVYRALRDVQNRTIFFEMATAAAAIAWSVGLTSTEGLAARHLLLAGAVVA